MPDNDVQSILDRAFSDEAFRRRLIADLEGTVKELDCQATPEILVTLRSALDEGQDFATGLDQRLSQSGVSLNPQALLKGQKVEKSSTLASMEHGGYWTGAGGVKKTERTEALPAARLENQHCRSDAASEPFDADEQDYEVETD